MRAVAAASEGERGWRRRVTAREAAREVSWAGSGGEEGNGCDCGLPGEICEREGAGEYCRYRGLLGRFWVRLTGWSEMRQEMEETIEREGGRGRAGLESWARRKVMIGRMEGRMFCRVVWLLYEAERAMRTDRGEYTGWLNRRGPGRR